MTDLVAFAGRFHPALVHLPIGCLLLAAVFELLGRTRRYEGVRAAVGPSLAVGAAAAVATAITGYALGTSGGYSGWTYTWHLRMGIGVAVGAVLTLAAHAITSPRRTGRAQRSTAGVYGWLLLLTVVHVGAAGHLGGTLTHGEGYLTEHLPPLLRFGGRAPAQATLPDPSRAIVYTTLVQPVLQERCVSCHGPDKAEGRLRLDNPEGVRKGGESGPVLVAGRPDASELVRRVWLPASHEDAMPPEGRRAMTVAEAALLRWWVAQGASFDGALGDVELTPDVQPVIEASLGPIDRTRPAILSVAVAAADPAAIARVTSLGVSVAPLAQGTSFLQVHVTNARAAFGDEQLAALATLSLQVTWLELGGTQVTDAGLAILARFTNLTRLHLDRTRVTDAGLAHLATLPRLEYLNLYGTPVTDAGLDRLKGLTALRTLHLWQTSVTPTGVERLRASLPRVHAELGTASAPPAGRSAIGAPPAKGPASAAAK